VKHVVKLSKDVPAAADEVQDVICSLNHSLATFIESKGGFQPIVAWLDDKCDIPEPNP